MIRRKFRLGTESCGGTDQGNRAFEYHGMWLAVGGPIWSTEKLEGVFHELQEYIGCR